MLGLGRRENGEKRNGGERRFLGCQVLFKRGNIVMYLFSVVLD